MTTLDELRKLDKGSRKNVCRVCGKPPVAQVIFQIRERGVSGKSITTLSAVTCEPCAIRAYEAQKKTLGH